MDDPEVNEAVVATISATRYHDFSCGHRVVGHESKCAYLHGHNYRVHFHCAALKLDGVGRVIDFSVIKEKLCNWLEQYWDHRFLCWIKDPYIMHLKRIDPRGVLAVSFNPTAENMAKYLLEVVGPTQLDNTGVRLVQVTVEETRKCSATAYA